MNRSTDLSRRSRRAVRGAVGATFAAGLLLAACGDDGGVAITGTAPPAPVDETVEVTLVDYAFEGLPDTVPAGTQFTVVNESKTELHELVAIRLDDDEDRSADELVELPMDELMAMFSGEPATVLLALPDGGEQIDAVGDGTLDEPGRYLIFCSIPTGADPQEYLEAAQQSGEGPPQVDGGAPHFVNGMYGEVTVES